MRGQRGGDFLIVGAHEAHGAGLDGFGALRRVAHDEHGFAQPRGLLLDAARVGEHDVGPLHQADEGEIFQRFDEKHVPGLTAGAAEHLVHGAPHVGVEVEGVDKVDRRVAQGQIAQGVADVQEALAEVFAAVARDEHEAAVPRVEARRVVARGAELGVERGAQLLVAPDAPRHAVEGVDELSGVGAKCHVAMRPVRRRFISSGQGL